MGWLIESAFMLLPELTTVSNAGKSREVVVVASHETLLEQLQRRQRVLDRRLAQLEFKVMVIGNKQSSVHGEVRRLKAEYALLSIDAMLGYYGAPQEAKVKHVIDWEHIYGDEE